MAGSGRNPTEETEEVGHKNNSLSILFFPGPPASMRCSAAHCSDTYSFFFRHSGKTLRFSIRFFLRFLWRFHIIWILRYWAIAWFLFPSFYKLKFCSSVQLMFFFRASYSVCATVENFTFSKPLSFNTHGRNTF